MKFVKSVNMCNCCESIVCLECVTSCLPITIPYANTAPTEVFIRWEADNAPCQHFSVTKANNTELEIPNVFPENSHVTLTIYSEFSNGAEPIGGVCYKFFNRLCLPM